MLQPRGKVISRVYRAAGGVLGPAHCSLAIGWLVLSLAFCCCPPLFSQGRLISFQVPGSKGTFPRSINSSLTIAGFYSDANSLNHGFVRDRGGNFTSFDGPG